jgi:hypothetical protein
LEASDNGRDFVVLKQHTNDSSINTFGLNFALRLLSSSRYSSCFVGGSATWKIDVSSNHKPFKYFRIVQTGWCLSCCSLFAHTAPEFVCLVIFLGKNSAGSDYLMLSGIELYGVLQSATEL